MGALGYGGELMPLCDVAPGMGPGEGPLGQDLSSAPFCKD